MSELKQFGSLDSGELATLANVHVAIGMFDGLHLGHQTVVESARKAAGSDGISGVLTFWPHPSRLFRPGDPVRMILSPEVKRRQMALQGVDFIVQEPFSQELADIAADDFLDFLKRKVPGLISIHAGENWRFGKSRSGDIAKLIALGKRAGIAVGAVPCLGVDAERVSSTRIRELLKLGDIEMANSLLGYEYYSIGTVSQGKRMGRQIGVPTLNLPFEGDLEPAYGVYVVTLTEADGRKRYQGVANFGVKPTVQTEAKALLEVHLLDECPFDYGHRLRVDWKAFVRQERKFDGLASLKAQIEIDIQSARQFFQTL